MMILNMWFIIFIMFLCGNMIFVSKHKHLLIVLLSLEFIVLSVFFLMMIYLNYIEYEMYMLMIFLLFTVCEGALGLSILVSMIRTHGNDYFKSFNLL
uniref:NADH-ubiquinone oxidoreductase chain 4L n=3 Tax=Parnassius TaxID=447236 RepID=A0A6H0DSA8_9NEOP|nr:NADH dehydrogenase subunit 4L [Parnassius epaphus]YP_009764361.1 NADH dehydrogenase subunit 4L [Parnassius mercurius]YP_010722426.1 NADH dehydrogenase subunit 4L [Parnassius dongalaicus]YP_010722452.1 NADH dehydrogenase subunit 4L [Parnassius nomion]YP_010729970.1 NADH dehydrogenase subunit 4L [Parnassius tianschanicus]YP_010729977.1 NADH dehydrogenase subunit 4L [Parnassius jacquemontii]WDV10559.1 NADH dehydrogenase subunit 4L [Parnassius jacquemontii tibetanus]AIV00499.1 NADH dehydrogen